MTGDDLLAYAVALSHANEEQRERLKVIGIDGFALARSRLQQAAQDVVEAEIVTNQQDKGDAGEIRLQAKKTPRKKRG
jgi:hypothetical protein